MSKFRLAAVEVIASKGTDCEKSACDRYRALLKEVGAPEDAIKMKNELLIEQAKFFLQTLKPHLRD